MRKQSEFAVLPILFALLIMLPILPRVPGIMVQSHQYGATLTEWTIPTASSGASALTLDRSGSCCWFVEYYGNKLGHFDAAKNTFQEWSIPTLAADPYDLAITSDPTSPMLWGTEFGSDKIFAFSPASGIFREYTLPHSNTGAGYISIEPSGPQVRVWFTETIRNANGELIYDPTSGNVTLYEDYFPVAVGGGAYGVYAESSSVWFAGFSALTRWDRATQQYTMWQLPAHGSAIGRFITVDPYGQAWYTQGSPNATSNDNYVGALQSNGIIEEWRLPSQGADPRKIEINTQSLQPWIIERSLAAANGAIAVLTNSSNGRLFITAATTSPSGGAPRVLTPISTAVVPTSSSAMSDVRAITGLSSTQFREYSLGPSSPQDVITDSHGNIWMSEPGTNKIAELSGFTQDFALSVTPSSISLPQGGSGKVTTLATAISGYQGVITIRALNQPPGVTLSSSVNTLSILQGDKNASAQLTLNVDPKATPGIIPLVLEASDGATTHTTSVLLTITNSTSGTPGKPQCVIATATYGSEISPEVEQLRAFRDKVLRSRIGGSFLTIFNSWYYSFSPSIANYIMTHSRMREVMKGVLCPLIGSLAIASNAYSAMSSYPECATLLSGILACCMIGAMYIGLPLSVVKRMLRISLRTSMWLSAFSSLVGFAGILVGLSQESSSLLMIGSAIGVVSMIWSSGALAAEAVSRLKFLERRIRFSM